MRTSTAIGTTAGVVALATTVCLYVPALAQPNAATAVDEQSRAAERVLSQEQIEALTNKVIPPDSTRWGALIEELESLQIFLRKLGCERQRKKGAAKNDCDPGCHCGSPIKPKTAHLWNCVVVAEVEDCQSPCEANFKCRFAYHP